MFRVFGCGNKLLSWPKTNCVVDVLLAGTICMYALLYMYLICTFFLCCNESKIKLSIKLKVRNIHRKTTGTHALIG